MTASAIGGRVAAGFDAVAEAFRGNFEDHGEVGAAVHVVVDGRVVVDLWGGYRDAACSGEWTADTLVNVYSVGKAFAAIMVLRLVDDGLVELDRPVASYWPDFGAAGKERATVRQLLCHRVGVPAIREPLTDADLFDFDTMVDAVARCSPWWEPGERHAYHTNTYGHLTGGLVQAVAGKRPGPVLAESIAGPIGADVFVGVPDAELDRCADIVWDGPAPGLDFEALEALAPDARMAMLSYFNPPGYSSIGVVNTAPWRQAQVPSTNTHATARGTARIYQGLLDGTVLRPDTIAEATRVQSSGWCPLLEQDVTFGLGFQPWTEQRPLGRSPGGYGHFGTGGALGFADPSHRIAFGYVMNQVTPRWQSPRNRALVDALYRCID